MRSLLCFVLIFTICIMCLGCVATPEATDTNGIPHAGFATTQTKGTTMSSREDHTTTTKPENNLTGTTETDVATTEGKTNEAETTESSTKQDTTTTSPNSKDSHSLTQPEVTLIDGIPNVPVSAVNVEPYAFKRTYKSGGRELIIDAQVYEPPVTQLHTFTAVLREIDASEKSTITEILAKGIALTPHSADPRLSTGNSARGEIRLSFGLNNFWGYMCIRETVSSSLKTAKDEFHAPGCDMSVYDAIETTEGIVNGFSRLDDMVPVYCRINEQAKSNGKVIDATGSYSVSYLQYVDNLPMPYDYIGGSVKQSVFSINDDGIYMAVMIPYDLTIKSTVDRWLSLEDACTRLENNLDSLHFSKYTPIFEISFEYMRDSNGSVTPVWRFCVDQMAILEQGLDQSVYQSNDIVVNAVTGEVFQTLDRYPSFVNADGSYTGGRYKNG